MILSVATEFSRTPGPRSQDEGEFSGEVFLRTLLLPRFEQAAKKGEKLLVDLDGTEGYATSFLEAAFGELARLKGQPAVEATLDLRSEDEPFLIDEIKGYIREAGRGATAGA